MLLYFGNYYAYLMGWTPRVHNQQQPNINTLQVGYKQRRPNRSSAHMALQSDSNEYNT